MVSEPTNNAPAGNLLRVTRLAQLSSGSLEALCRDYGLAVEWTEGAIAGSYWGESEAGLIERRLIVRSDTPVHSALHEACHAICAQAAGRNVLHADAGGDDLEECAVCYLQILLADRLPGYSRQRMLVDMDAWGYSFRLGSARAWFERDASDARSWLEERGLLPQATERATRPPAASER